MTDAIRTKIDELKQLITTSDEYHNYDVYSRLLEQMPDIKAEVNEFRKKRFDMQLGGIEGYNVATTELAEEYKDLLTNSVVREFLNAEITLCRLLQQVSEALVGDLELELDFL